MSDEIRPTGPEREVQIKGVLRLVGQIDGQDASYLLNTVFHLRKDVARLRAENAACHKVIIDAMAALPHALVADTFGEVDAETVINAVIDILDSAPEPSDETLAAIEAGGE